MEPFIESGMTFGPYAEGHCFRVEHSATYRKVQDGLQMAEFLLLRTRENTPPFIWIVEAKSSSPRPATQPNFAEFIGEIRDKLTNALNLGVAAMLNRHTTAAGDLSEHYKKLNLAIVGFRLILIVNGHQRDWLPPLQDALRGALLATSKIWALDPNAVVVINHEDAKKLGLITAP